MTELYLDEDVHKKVALSLRLKGYDVVSAHELQKWGLSDRDQLEFAINEGRAIFTFNVKDFIELHLQYYRMNQKHHGIIVSKQLSLAETVRRLSILLFRRRAQGFGNQLFWL